MSGRANIISDKEFRDKNKVLTTSNQPKHGENHNGSSKDEMMCVFSRGRVFLRPCSFFVDFHFFPLVCSRHTFLSLGDFAVYTEH